jgi:hypothetical protein
MCDVCQRLTTEPFVCIYSEKNDPSLQLWNTYYLEYHPGRKLQWNDVTGNL